jgi:hypothetical protein
MEDKLLIRNNEDQVKLLDLFLLKSATEWLEKQNWISSPYGGDNYLEDIIFRIKLLSGQEWQSVFQEGKIPYDLELIKEYFEMIKTIDPSIKKFCDGVLKGSSNRTELANLTDSRSP